MDGISMTPLALSVLSILACVMSVKSVRYGDYAAVHMPQYGDQQDSDIAEGHGEYSDKSPDASPRLDYKYEEEPHGKSDDLPVKEIYDERTWHKSNNKKRKPLTSREDANSDDSLDETDPELKSNIRYFKHRANFRNRNLAKQSEPRRRLKHNSINRYNDIDNVEIRNDYVHTEDIERADGVDLEEKNSFSLGTTRHKPRRKPRDRALHKPEGKARNKKVKLEEEEMDVRSDADSYESKNSRRYGGIIDRERISKTNKNNYDYDEYYDMKRVQRIKNRLPALLIEPTVRTTEAESTSYSEPWLSRRGRAGSPLERYNRNPATKQVTSSATITTPASTTTSPRTTTTKTTTKPQSPMENSSELSLAEKSRLSILKKAQRKESSMKLSSSTKPPVLMQVTNKMQTVVLVEPRSPETALRAREVLDDSPERLQRARRLMRRKLVAGARSIHELTDNWDEMVCDYIDVSLLDSDTASYTQMDGFVTVPLLLMTLLIYY